MGVHGVADGRSLGAEDLLQAKALIAAVRSLHLGSPAYVKRQGLDPSVFLPANIWAEITNTGSFMDWNDTMIALVRLISPYSGFHLATWRRQDSPDHDAASVSGFYTGIFSGALNNETAAADLETRFGWSRRVQEAGLDLESAWRKLCGNTPERFRIKAEPCAGEAGWRTTDGYILSPDTLSHQSRINALWGSGMLTRLDELIAKNGVAHYLEIGSGHGGFAHALWRMFGKRLNVWLVDLPISFANACAYLTCAAGAQSIALADSSGQDLQQRPFTLVANTLVPAYRSRMPKFDLVHNAISMNEMSAIQVEFYLGLIEDCLAPGGRFHLSQGGRHLDYHVDAIGMTRARFPIVESFDGADVGGVPVSESPNTLAGVM